MRIKNLIINVYMLVSISACTAFKPSDVANPSKLTISEAMNDIGMSFAKLKSQLSNNSPNSKPLHLGLWPCKVVVTLNVTAGATDNAQLVLDTAIRTPANAVNAEIKGHAEKNSTSSASRGNTVNIELYNSACIPKDTIGYDKPEHVKDISDALSDDISHAQEGDNYESHHTVPPEDNVMYRVLPKKIVANKKIHKNTLKPRKLLRKHVASKRRRSTPNNRRHGAPPIVN